MRTIRFTFLCSNTERQLIAELAEALQRSQSDALRWIIRAAVSEIQAYAGTSNDAQHNVVCMDGEDEN